jgi:hypothetical protein
MKYRTFLHLLLWFALLTGCSFPLFSEAPEIASPAGEEGQNTQPGSSPQDNATQASPSFTSTSTGTGFPAECPPYPADFQFVEVPDPLSGDNPVYPLVERPMPDVGECFLDDSFGTVLQRVTQDEGVNGRHEYSRHDPYNADHSLALLITDQGGFRVYRTSPLPYNQPGNLVLEFSQTEPRWDPQDPALLWALQDFSIVNIHVDSGEVSIIKDFTQDGTIGPLISEGNTYRVTMMDEGEASYDRQWWALSLQGNDRMDYRHQVLFTWNLEKDAVQGVYPLDSSEDEIDWVGMSPLGNWVLIGGMETNSGNTAGLTMASTDFSTFHRLDYTTSHADVGLDTNGNEVVVMQSYNTDTIDLIPLELSTRPILEAGGSEDGSGRVPLMRLYYASDDPLGLNSGVHISCNTPGYCFISTTIAPGAAGQNWLDRSLVLVRLDRQNPRVFYIAKLHNTTSEEPRVYWDETHGTLSTDGTRLLWVENWGENVGQESFFLVQMLMPENWRALTGD